MSATSRMGILLLLAACGGGRSANRADTAAMSGARPTDTAVTGSAADTAAAAAAPAAPAAPVPASSAATSHADTAKPATKSVRSTKAVAQDTAKPRATSQDTAKRDTTKQDTAKKAAAAKPSAGGGPTPQQVALGDSIFHGQVAGGTCTACHGQDAKGTAVAPNLTDSQWLNGDGSYQFIVHTVTTGVPKPKEHPAPMPPKGGANLTDDQVKAVAAYVYSLSHKI